MIEIDRHAPLTVQVENDSLFHAIYVAYVDGYVEVVWPAGSRRFDVEVSVVETHETYDTVSYEFSRKGGWRTSFTLRVVQAEESGEVNVDDTLYEVTDG